MIKIVLLLALILCSSVYCYKSPSQRNKYTNNNNRNEELGSDNPPSTPFSPGLALQFLLLSYNSYCSQQTIVQWNCVNCEKFPTLKVNAVIYNNVTDTQAYVATYNNTVFIAFRGSMDIDSWITNLKFLQVPYPGVTNGMVHSGFYEGYTSVQQQVYTELQSALKACPDCTGLYVTGHSLGGALATLCMMDVAQWFGDKIYTEAYTFGSPRVGNDELAAYYNSLQPNTYRVVNQDDLVPHVPPRPVLMGDPVWPEYHHVPDEIWYESNTTDYVQCSAANGEDPNCSDSVDPLHYSIYDHLHYLNQHCCC